MILYIQLLSTFLFKIKFIKNIYNFIFQKRISKKNSFHLQGSQKERAGKVYFFFLFSDANFVGLGIVFLVMPINLR